MTQTIEGIEGHHLFFDLEGCDKEFLSDPERITSFIEEVVAEIGMIKISPIISKIYHSADPQDWGVSANLLIAESHIVTHTYPEKRCAWLDIFSCREIPIALVGEIVRDHYKPTDYKEILHRRDLKGIE